MRPPYGFLAGAGAGAGADAGAGAFAAGGAAAPGVGTSDGGMFFALAESALAAAFTAAATARSIPAGTTRASYLLRSTRDTGSDTSTNCALFVSNRSMN